MTGPTVEAASSGASYWGTAVSDMQSNLTVDGNRIKGTLKKLTSGQLVTDWGAGYFMALNFANIPEGATVRVGFVPTPGKGFVTLDEDHDGVFKITDKDTQVFKVITKLNGEEHVDTYTLSSLVLTDN